MGLDHSGVLTVGTLVPKEGEHTLLHNTLLVFYPGVESHRSRWLPKVVTLGQFPCNTWSTRHTPAGWLQTLRRLKLHGQNAPKTASPRHCEKKVLLGGT